MRDSIVARRSSTLVACHSKRKRTGKRGGRIERKKGEQQVSENREPTPKIQVKKLLLFLSLPFLNINMTYYNLHLFKDTYIYTQRYTHLFELIERPTDPKPISFLSRSRNRQSALMYKIPVFVIMSLPYVAALFFPLPLPLILLFNLSLSLSL